MQASSARCWLKGWRADLTVKARLTQDLDCFSLDNHGTGDFLPLPKPTLLLVAAVTSYTKLPDEGHVLFFAASTVLENLREKGNEGAGEMTPRLRALATPAEGPDSAPSTQVRQLTNACHSSSRGPSTLFWSPQASLQRQCTNKQSYLHTLKYT